MDDDMPGAEADKALNIHYNSLYRWISEYEEYGECGESAFPGHGTALYSCQYEIKKLRQGNDELKDERLDLLSQLFLTDVKNKIWVGDITYIHTKKGTLHLAVFIHLFSRKVVGWSMSNKIKSILAVEAFLQTYGNERPNAGLIVHTD